MGARIGRGVWLETYWLPESDLVRLGDGATVNRGCVVQTHLFHDRIMSMDEVRIDEGATLGPERDHPAGREHRRGDDGRAGLAGHARRHRARGDPLAGQPDHDVELSRKPTAGAARSDDPYLPEHGNGGYRVEHYDLDIDYRWRPTGSPDGR